MWKKFVSLLLCMGFAFATFCTSAVAVAPGLTIYASGATSEAEAQRRLNEIRAVLPGESSSNHATFTVNGVACTHGSWNTCTNCNFKNVMSQRLGITPLRSGAAYTCYGLPASCTNISSEKLIMSRIRLLCFKDKCKVNHKSFKQLRRWRSRAT